jgi:hypothetical protein
MLLWIVKYNNKTIRVWFQREQKHASDVLWPRKPRGCRSRGFPGQRPSRVCFCSLRNHTSGFIFIPCHKNYRKTTFNSGIPHAKFAITLRRRSNDITSTCPTMRMTSLRIPDDTDATEEIRITHMLYLIFLYHARIPRLDRRTPQVKFC